MCYIGMYLIYIYIKWGSVDTEYWHDIFAFINKK